MVGSEFASCWLKFGRAHEHLNTLKADLSEWHSNDPYIVSSNSDADGSRYGFVVEIKTQPRLEQWSLIAGDCIHNLRSALDTALYAVAVRENHGVDPPPNAGSLQFPICDAPGALAEMSRRKLVDLSTKAHVWIERAQPYNRSHRSKPPLLRLLREFDNLDKHRLLNVDVKFSSTSTVFTTVTPSRDKATPVIILKPQTPRASTPICSSLPIAVRTISG